MLQGKNDYQVSAIQDEVVFAVDRVETVGQLIGLIVATDATIAKAAALAVKVEYKVIPGGPLSWV